MCARARVCAWVCLCVCARARVFVFVCACIVSCKANMERVGLADLSTPLLVACSRGDWKIARLLLSRGASPHSRDANNVNAEMVRACRAVPCRAVWCGVVWCVLWPVSPPLA